MTVFVVRRLGRSDDSGHPVGGGERAEPVRAFANRAAAEDHALQLRRRCGSLNPFTLISERTTPAPTSLDESRLHDWLLDCGLPTPPDYRALVWEWRRWWDEHAPALSEWQRLRAWEAFDGIKLYDVVEVELAD